MDNCAGLIVRASPDLFQELPVFCPLTVALDGPTVRQTGILEISQGEMSLGQQVEGFCFLGRLFQRALQIAQGLRRFDRRAA